MMRYFSMFSGCGGIDLGIPPEWECVGMAENDKWASAVLRKNFPGVVNYGDVEKIKWKSVADFDVLVGGSPCQGLSVAGKRKGLADSRSRLFFEFVRALKEKKPSYFIFENVRDLFSSNAGADALAVFGELASAGYVYRWEVFNAVHFVPQNRERIFVIGYRGERCPGEVLRERRADTKNTRKERRAAVNCIDTGYDKGVDNKGQRTILAVNCITGSYTRNLGGKGQGSLIEMNKRRYRILTPLECERCMGWPDNWTAEGIDEKGEVIKISNSQRYSMIGNGVVPQIIEKIVLVVKDDLF